MTNFKMATAMFLATTGWFGAYAVKTQIWSANNVAPITTPAPVTPTTQDSVANSGGNILDTYPGADEAPLTPVAPPTTVAPLQNAPSADADPVIGSADAQSAADTFYQPLAENGTWRNDPTYGQVWQPEVAVGNPSWRPYEEGSWKDTDQGWYFQSSAPWSWAAYHYGRWFHDARLGWSWVPGRVWAPSWVSWRQANDCYGWAPLPPDVGFAAQTGLTWHGSRVDANCDFGLRPEQYTFVRSEDFLALDCQKVQLPAQQVVNIYKNSTVINNTYIFENNKVVNIGLDVHAVENVTHQNIKPIRVPIANTPTAGIVAVRPTQADQTAARQAAQQARQEKAAEQAKAREEARAAQQLKAQEQQAAAKAQSAAREAAQRAEQQAKQAQAAEQAKARAAQQQKAQEQQAAAKAQNAAREAAQRAEQQAKQAQAAAQAKAREEARAAQQQKAQEQQAAAKAQSAAREAAQRAEQQAKAAEQAKARDEARAAQQQKLQEQQAAAKAQSAAREAAQRAEQQAKQAQAAAQAQARQEARAAAQQQAKEQAAARQQANAAKRS